MGTLSDAFTSAFLGPLGTGYNADGSPYAPAPVDCAALGQDADSAIPNAQDLSAETAGRMAADANLDVRVTAEIEARQTTDANLANEIVERGSGDAAIQGRIAAEIAARQTTDANLATETATRQSEIGDAVRRLDQAEPAIAHLQISANGVDRTLAILGQDRDTFRADLSTKLGTLDRLLGTAALSSRDRIGDNLFLFTPSLSGPGPRCPPLPDGGVVVTASGPVYRATGAQVIRRRAPIWLEPGRVHALRFAVARLAKPSDPDGDAIRCGIACLDANGALISTVVVRDLANVGPADGLQIVPTRFPSQAGDAVSLQPPAGCVFWAPYLQSYGADGITDFVMLADTDATDAGSYSPDLAAVQAEITALQTAVAALNPLAAGTANGLATLDGTGTVAQLPMLKSAFLLAAAQAVPGALELLDNAVAIQGDETISILHRSPYLAAGDAWVVFAQATLGLTAAQIATILTAIGSPSQRSGYVAPNPVFDLDVTRAAVIDAARLRFSAIPGASLKAFVGAFIGDQDAADGSWTAFWAADAAPVGGLLYALMLSYLISPAPAPALSQQAAVAQLTAIWAAAASLPA